MINKLFYSLRYNNSPRLAAETFMCFVKIKPDNKGDATLLPHELVHVKQFYKLLVVGLLLTTPLCFLWGVGAIPYMLLSALLHDGVYKVSKTYRLKCEIEAYRETIKYLPKGASIDYIVDSLCNSYSLHANRQAIIDKLTKK